MSFAAVGMVDSFGFGKSSIAFGTVISQVIPPKQRKKTKLTRFSYTAAGTAHTLTVFRALNRTTVKTAAAAAQAVVTLTADPGVYNNKSTANNILAANDYLLFKRADATWHLALVSSVAAADGTGAIAVTLTANVPTLGFAAGTPCWFFGITTDTDPQTSVAHPQFTAPASATTNFFNEGFSIIESILRDSPLLLQSNNITATGTIELGGAVYGP